MIAPAKAPHSRRVKQGIGYRYARIPVEMFDDRRLKLIDVFVYGDLLSIDVDNDGLCLVSERRLAQRRNVSLDTVRVGRVFSAPTRAHARGEIMLKRTGRPTLLTPELQSTICRALELSVPDKYAAESAGISDRAFREWCEQGESGREPYAAFLAAVTRARARAVVRLTLRALRGSSQATWLLERRYREDYGPVQKVQLGGDPDGAPLGVQRDTIAERLDQLSVEELRAIARGSGSDILKALNAAT